MPVVVRDSHGNAVRGLTENDFRVLENRHEVRIRSFEVVSAASTGQAPTAPWSLQTPSRQIEPPVVILFFDQVNTPGNEQAEVRRRLASWYQTQQTLAMPTCVILFSGSALRIVQQPTMEGARVQAAIESIPTTINSRGAGATGALPLPDSARENYSGVFDWQLIPERRLARLDYFWHRAMSDGDTGSALIYAAQMFAAWPGEKALIWVSAGTTTKVWTEPIQVEQVKVYAIDVHTDMNYRSTASFTSPDSTYEYETEVNNQLLQNMRDVTQETGGELCRNSLEPQLCVMGAVRDATDHYLVTYETHSRSSRPEWRQIQVKVNRRGIAVSARTGVMIAPLTAENKKREQIVDALVSSIDLPGLLLDSPSVARTSAGQSLTLSLRLRSDASHPGVWSAGGMDFTVATCVLKGRQLLQCFAEDIHSQLSRETGSELDGVGLAWSHQMAAPQDVTAVRVVVRDNKDGRIGSITQGLP